jgi:SPP1 gp7 family putative phage head morphogenesis protein
VNREAYERRLARLRWRHVRQTESYFARQLRKVSEQVGHLVKGMAPDGVIQNQHDLQMALRQYAVVIRPWASIVAERMQADVMLRDEKAWLETAHSLGRELRRELAESPAGMLARQHLADQVNLITSLPLDAAKRVHELTLEGIINSTRAAEIRDMILSSGSVNTSRANLIARTEVARTASLVTQSRAEHLGSPGYIWRSVGDSDVRKLHQKLNGTFHRWAEPPISGERGERAHAGQIYNCRCYPEPVLDEERLRVMYGALEKTEAKTAAKAA